MLLQFRFENYKSFKKLNQMDFITSNEKSHETHYVEINQQRILTTLAIHGSNASGKSNCILAFLTMANMILNSVFHENLDYFEEIGRAHV